VAEEDKEVIRISAHDLADPRVDDIVAQQQAGRMLGLGRQAAPATPFWLTPTFYLAVAGALGAFCGWGMIEPFFVDGDDETSGNVAATVLFFPTIGGMIGLFIGATEGMMSRNLVKGLLGGGIGLAVGFAGGFVSMFAANIIMTLMVTVGAGVTGVTEAQIEARGIRGAFFLSLVMARSLAWAVAGLTVGLGQGIAMRSGKLVTNGLLGGMLGGAVGGLFFDPVCRVLAGPKLDEFGEPSRAIGVTCVGAMAGLFVGLVEHFAKEAWLLMVAGPLAGKQFVVYKNPTSLGSSPKCDVYLFKDPAIEPRHALIHKVGVHYEIEDCGSSAGTRVNDGPVKRQRLQDGDRIQLGDTLFLYSERARERPAVG
jgi:hypothetical protein